MGGRKDRQESVSLYPRFIQSAKADKATAVLRHDSTVQADVELDFVRATCRYPRGPAWAGEGVASGDCRVPRFSLAVPSERSGEPPYTAKQLAPLVVLDSDESRVPRSQDMLGEELVEAGRVLLEALALPPEDADVGKPVNGAGRAFDQQGSSSMVPKQNHVSGAGAAAAPSIGSVYDWFLAAYLLLKTVTGPQPRPSERGPAIFLAGRGMGAAIMIAIFAAGQVKVAVVAERQRYASRSWATA